MMNDQNQVISKIEHQIEILFSDYKSTRKMFLSIFLNFVQVPEISEIMANLFGGGGSSGSSVDKTKKKQKPHVTRRS